MKTLYIHIGTPKTGTTAIQQYLCQNRAALAKAGWCYPDLGMNGEDPVAHHQLALSFIRRERLDRGALLAQIEASGSNRILLSSEFFWGARNPESIRRAFGGCAVKIIVYFRRQDDFLLSYFQQDVRTGIFGGSLRAFQRRLERRNRLDYHAFCEEWGAIFGRENVLVRPYDPVKSVIASFLETLGMVGGNFAEAGALDVNRSMDARLVGAMRAAVQLGAEGLDQQLVAQLVSAIRNHTPLAEAANGHRHHSLMNYRERSALLERYRESNQMLSDQYLNGASFPVLEPDAGEVKISDSFILPDLFKELIKVTAQWHARLASPGRQ